MASKRSSSAAAPWPALPSDLLSLVLLRLHSLADRVRVRAVCRQWRSGLQQPLPLPLPPPMPWIALGAEAYIDIVNGAVHRPRALRIPPDACGRGSVDHLLFLTRAGGGCFLADPFSGAVLPVVDLAFFIKKKTREEMVSPCCRRRRLSLSVQKVVAHWPQGSSSATAEPVVAALITNSENSYKTTIFVCRAGTETGLSKDRYSTMSVDLRRVMDIAFFRGNLYALSTHCQLLTVDIGEGSGGNNNPSITGVKYAIKSPRAGSYDDFEEEMVDFLAEEDVLPIKTKKEYLIESGDQLLKLNQWVINGYPGPGDTDSFNVYEAELDASPCRWKPVHSLRWRALFVGRYRYCSSSKSVPVGDGNYGAQEDCIYFIRHAGDSGIYNIRSRKMTTGALVPDTEVQERRSWHWQAWIRTWVFPDPSVVRSHYLKRFEVQAHGASELDDLILNFLEEEALV